MRVVTMTCRGGAVSDQGASTPNQVLTRDARTLIGLSASVEGALLVGEVTELWARKLHGRFVREGLLPAGSAEHEVALMIKDINHRLRYAIGEYPSPAAPVPVP
jgi:hypothetical protein